MSNSINRTLKVQKRHVDFIFFLYQKYLWPNHIMKVTNGSSNFYLITNYLFYFKILKQLLIYNNSLIRIKSILSASILLLKVLAY